MAARTQIVGDRWRKPAREITDRAARYRANAPDALPPGERRCIFCGSKRAMDVCHLDGHEKNTDPRNLSYCCRSDNVRVANVMRAAGLGTKTRQYNPTTDGAKSLAQWVTAVLSMKGESDQMPVGEAVDIIRATPHTRRSKFAKEIWQKRRRNPFPRGVKLTRKQKDAYLAALDYWINVEGATEEKAAIYAREDVLKQFPELKKTARPNPDESELREAERLYDTFHGRKPREILEIQERSETRGEYTALGELVELTIIAPTGEKVIVSFKEADNVRVASSPSGEQLYLIGGNQDLSDYLGMFGADDGKDLIDLGELKQIVYGAAKWVTNFTFEEYKHNLGEESGVRPRAFYDQLKQRIFFAGGTYQVKRPGIVD